MVVDFQSKGKARGHGSQSPTHQEPDAASTTDGLAAHAQSLEIQEAVEGAGAPIPYLSEMEAGFGRGLGHVRAHFGQEAQRATQALGAKAFTLGSDIVFSQASPSRALVAHELAHTIQQGSAAMGQSLELASGGGGAEREADAAAAAVLSGRAPSIRERATGVQCWIGSEHEMMGDFGANRAIERFLSEEGTDAFNAFARARDIDVREAGASGAIEKRQGMTLEVGGAKEESIWSPSAMVGSTPHSFEQTELDGKSVLPGSGKMTAGEATKLGGDHTKTAADLLEQDYANLYVLAITNYSHFFPLAGAEYRAHHAKALEEARKVPAAFDKKLQFRKAITLEGFAGHFLQDSFASGHMAPRALDPLGNAGPGTAKDPMRSKNWHDLLCALPDGLPTDKGRFHGDAHMDGADLEHIGQQTASSFYEVLAAASGKESKWTAIEPAAPDKAAILRDPVAGPIWRKMSGDYAQDLVDAEARDEGLTTAPGTKLSAAEVAQDVVAPLQAVLASSPQPDPGSPLNSVYARLVALGHFLQTRWEVNNETGLDDSMEISDGESGHFGIGELRDSGLLHAAVESAVGAQLPALREVGERLSPFLKKKGDVAELAARIHESLALLDPLRPGGRIALDTRPGFLKQLLDLEGDDPGDLMEQAKERGAVSKGDTGPLNRAEAAQIIANLEGWTGVPPAQSIVPFADVEPGDWFYDPALHARLHGIFLGTRENQFMAGSLLSVEAADLVLERYLAGISEISKEAQSAHLLVAPPKDLSSQTTSELLISADQGLDDRLRAELEHRKMRVSVTTVKNQDTFGSDAVSVRVATTAGNFSTDTVKMNDGDSHGFEIPLGSLVPTGGAITVEIFERDYLDADDLLVHMEWAEPYDAIANSATERGADYEVNASLE